MNDTMNHKEKIFGFIYVFLLFLSISAICCWLLFNYNNSFRLYSQKEYVISKMNRIKDYQDAQASYRSTVDSLYTKINRYNPGINAVYEENEIEYMVNSLKNVYETKAWDKRYKSFLHIGEFYDMWFTDKKELWSKQDNITRFKENLKQCEIGLNKKKDELNAASKK